MCQMDDILIWGETQEEHDKWVEAVLAKVKLAGITLNAEKCEFDTKRMKFLGHIIDCRGIHVDPAKTEAIKNFSRPKDRKGLRRFFGMINYLGKFSATLSDDSVNLRELLRKERDWIWSTAQEEDFIKLKEKLISAPTLAPYNLQAATVLSTDASSYGLGAAILQRVDGEWKPVAYASRTMTEAEMNYAQIEKEALAICWGCDKFHYYLAGRQFQVETDHKPLISVLGDKEIAKLPIRIQRFRLRMMSYSYQIRYTPGEKLVLADALSRAPLPDLGTDMNDTGMVSEIISALPIAAAWLARLQAATLDDYEASQLMQYITTGWPAYSKVVPDLQKFYTFKDNLTVIDSIVYYDDRVFVPKSEQEVVLKDIHAGHQGESKCIRRATGLV